MGLTKALWDRLGDQKRLTGRGQHSKSLSHAHWELYKNIGTGVPTADSDLTDPRGFVVVCLFTTSQVILIFNQG